MSGDMPDWLSELMPVSEEEEPLQKAAPEDKNVIPLRTDAQASQRARPQEAAPEGVDLMDDLRSQVAAQEVAPVVAPKKVRSRYVLGGLLPWQAFFLSVLLFLDVAIVGMLFLVMLGRVVL
jgi:hypothetical protein